MLLSCRETRHPFSKILENESPLFELIKLEGQRPKSDSSLLSPPMRLQITTAQLNFQPSAILRSGAKL